MMHMLRSRFGVRRIERVIMSATSSTDSFDGSGLSSSSSVMTLGPIGLSSGMTRISDFTSCIQPDGLSVMSCSITIELGVSGSLHDLLWGAVFTSPYLLVHNRTDDFERFLDQCVDGVGEGGLPVGPGVVADVMCDLAAGDTATATTTTASATG
uniref:Uncharacterized protein n=1 Tax=Anopheles farauti TaxID=69004 RepID=A0A182QTS4_9DIPT